MSQPDYNKTIPGWVSYLLVPVLNLLLAVLIAGIVIFLVGANPFEAFWVLLRGAFGSQIGYTLYYTTNFIFTGLAVSVAYHAGLFNIGAEGQLYIAGLGVGLVCLFLGGSLPLFILFPLAMIAAFVFGGIWAGIPGWLQAKRGSHIVITTIMFNFIAAALMTYLLAKYLKAPDKQAPESALFDSSTHLPLLHEMFQKLGIEMGFSPANLTLGMALFAAFLVWIFIWHTRWGYKFRVLGHSHTSAIYGGISVSKNTIVAMVISGGLAGIAALNILLGETHRLILDLSGGFGFIGIAVSFMGRQHPFGICLAGLLFGALYQGGSEIAFEIPQIDRDIVVVLQGLIILFCGALNHLLEPKVKRAYDVLFLR